MANGRDSAHRDPGLERLVETQLRRKPPFLIQDIDARFRGKPEAGDLDLTRRGEVCHLDEGALGSTRHLEERRVQPHVAPALLPICCQAGQPDNYCGGMDAIATRPSVRKDILRAWSRIYLLPQWASLQIGDLPRRQPTVQAGLVTLRNCHWLGSRFYRVGLAGVILTKLWLAAREFRSQPCFTINDAACSWRVTRNTLCRTG